MGKHLFLVGVLVGLSVWAASALASDGVGQRAGERIDQAVERIRGEAKDLAGQVREGFENVREAVHRMNVAARVYARLHWDKTLNEETISVDVSRDGVATLQGQVRNGDARRRAEDLANATVGVTRVVNGLTVVGVQEPTTPDDGRK